MYVEQNSWFHKRRIARWWDKALQLNPLGYLVVTVPAELVSYILSCDKIHAQEILKNLRTYWKRKLFRDLKISKGLMNYHWAGDDGFTFKPHLNICMDNNRWVASSELNSWQQDYLKWIEKIYPVKVCANTMFLNYQCKSKKKNILHVLKYITRSTMRVYNKQYAEIIKGFRNFITIGNFNKQGVNTSSNSS